MVHTVTAEIGGKKITMETGHLAKQAGGAVLISCGDSRVLVTACAAPEPREKIDFFPLTVDYREHTSAAGKIPGGFFKREGRPSKKEVLTSRLIDRPLRPLFPEGFQNETQVIANVYSFDGENETEMLALTGASAALCISDIPFDTTIAGVRVGLIDGQFVVNPLYPEKENSKLDLVIAGTEDAIVMVEAGAKEVSAATMVEAMTFGHEQIRKLVAAQRELQSLVAPHKWEVTPKVFPAGLGEKVKAFAGDRLLESLQIKDKIMKYNAVRLLKKETKESFEEDEQFEAGLMFDHVKERLFRETLLTRERRLDGRAYDEIRPITCEVGVLPRTHGSAIFTRGETQALVMTTLGTFGDAQMIDGLEGEEDEKFMLHYNFPPFSVGEVKFMRSPGRREIGHGALAKRGIEPMMPNMEEDEFPYVVRLVSEILESNGSSSMATVCGGVLALMDAGVPLKKPVAGIAMGMVKEGEKYAILTDIAGEEDHYGDMDFKVTGTRDGITALQMDLKVQGLTEALMAEALDQAVRAYNEILDKIVAALPAPRDNYSPYAPRITSIKVHPDKIREIIGPGGKVIREIVEKSGAKIDIEDDGTCLVAATSEESAKLAMDMIRQIIQEPEVGTVYKGTVKRIEKFGAFVEVLPGKDGLLHISEIANYRVRSVEDELQLGQEIDVKLMEIDSQGRLNLSRKVLLPREDGDENRNSGHQQDRGNRDNVRRDDHRGGSHGPRGNDHRHNQ
ncbi:MAG: polyribonucleotide nucleotidyltransferase [Acidobacteria bacterium CG_4_9_14_3_um_filter_49_7]|nr:MAG: polyribonucleotide nucleotidyltransferase [Acidobacteria bacterium CG_4_9_14_3_um_filter_49_7]